MIITEILVLDKKKLYAIDPPHKAGDRAFHLGSEIGDGISDRIQQVVVGADDVHITSPPQPDLQRLRQSHSKIHRSCSRSLP